MANYDNPYLCERGFKVLQIKDNSILKMEIKVFFSPKRCFGIIIALRKMCLLNGTVSQVSNVDRGSLFQIPLRDIEMLSFDLTDNFYLL